MTTNSVPYTINANGRLLDLSEPRIMGILNVTPDSFFSDSRKQTEEAIAQRVRQIVDEGGDIVDVGAYSTRPGHSEVSEEEEIRRLDGALSIIRTEAPQAIVSVDTFRASVAQHCIEQYGIALVNDVSGGADVEMFATVAQTGTAYVLTCPQAETMMFFSERVNRLLELGQKDIILDPGFGFGKTMEENFRLFATMDQLGIFGLPLLVGISRKRMIYQTLNCTPEEALNGTTVLNTLALERGARLLRVHDVAACKQVVKIFGKYSKG